MLTTGVRDIYHAYFWQQINEGNEPLDFKDWYDSVFVPWLSGRELILTNTN